MIAKIKERNMANEGRDNQFLIQGSILAAASLIVRMIGLIYRIPMTRIIGDEVWDYIQLLMKYMA